MVLLWGGVKRTRPSIRVISQFAKIDLGCWCAWGNQIMTSAALHGPRKIKMLGRLMYVDLSNSTSHANEHAHLD